MKLIVTSGPTREFVDPIRFLSNPSTGRMGHAIAVAGQKAGFNVVYIAGAVPKNYRKVEGAENLSATTTQNMLDAVISHLEDSSILVMAAAPADYRPEVFFHQKLKKKEEPFIKLVPNPDILHSVADLVLKKKILVYRIGFAAETHNIEEFALKKLKEKNLHLIFLNDLNRPGSGFGVDTNELLLFRQDGSRESWPEMSKVKAGEQIISEIVRLTNI